MFNRLHASMRMLTAERGDLMQWADEIWPGGAARLSATVDVAAESSETGWRIWANREGFDRMSPGSARTGRTEEAAFFLFAYEKRALLLERILQAIAEGAPEALRSAGPAPIVPIAALVEGLSRLRQADGEASPAQIRGAALTVMPGKIARIDGRDMQLSTLVDVSSTP